MNLIWKWSHHWFRSVYKVGHDRKDGNAVGPYFYSSRNASRCGAAGAKKKYSAEPTRLTQERMKQNNREYDDAKDMKEKGQGINVTMFQFQWLCSARMLLIKWLCSAKMQLIKWLCSVKTVFGIVKLCNPIFLKIATVVIPPLGQYQTDVGPLLGQYRTDVGLMVDQPRLLSGCHGLYSTDHVNTTSISRI